MRGRTPGKFQLKPTHKAYLRKLLREGKTPWRIARRAQILLQRADKKQRVSSLSEKFAQSASTIWRICQRYRDGGLEAALYDTPRPGRPRVFFQKSTPRD
jgi:transposase